jgi:hypothetical protein
MNDTPTGIAVNLNPASKDVLIYLAAGNACFNPVSCALTANPNGYDAKSLATDPVPTQITILQRTSANPLQNDNFVYVPYCTGDLHAGDVSGQMVAGMARNFHGFKNMTSFLKRIVATFPNPGRVILAGSSAGGFGAALNYDQAAKAFGATKVALLDDCGPMLTGAASDGTLYVPDCLQKAFVDTWALDKNFPTGCADCGKPAGVFTEPLARYLFTTYPDREMGLISGTADQTISSFLSFAFDAQGNYDQCTTLDIPGMYPSGWYAASLADLRDRVAKGAPNFHTYYVDGSDGSDPKRHVYLDYTTPVESNGVFFTDWLGKFVSGDPSITSVPPAM